MGRGFLYTQEQARAITGIGQETLRHWRKVVPYLAIKSGKAARFSFSDLVGLLVTRRVTERLGVNISQVQGGIDCLFRLLANEGIFRAGTVAVVQSSVSLLMGSEAQLKELLNGPTVLIPLDQVIEDLQAKLLSGVRLPPRSVDPLLAEAASR